MRLYARNITPRVEVDAAANRPVVLRMCGLLFALSVTEARILADLLHDGAEEAQQSTAPKEAD